MKQRGRKRRICAIMATLLCVPIAFGILAGCGGKSSEIAQTTEKDSAAKSFTALDKVEITDAYAVNAMALEREYLVQTLDEDRLLYWFYKNAGLTPKASSSYGGEWEGALIGGHTLGHYLSALAQAYANANTPASGDNSRALFLERIEYVIDALAECQDNAVKAGAKTGFIWGAKTIGSNPEIQFDNVEKNLTNIGSQAWVPWYTMHKILQGLIDAYTYTGSSLALEVAKNLGDWVYNRVKDYSSAMQQRVLNIEYGGMNDSLYTLYSLTGKEEYAVAAHMFDEETLFTKVMNKPANYLDGLHANTTIPKILGALNRYVALDGKMIDGETVDALRYLDVAMNFWDYVIEHHTYITGGNSEWEHFGKDDVLNAERTYANCETCNTYNMLKLSRTLFTITGDKKYLDYYENTYYNAIWSSQNPETGMTTYFQPMATGLFKVYSSATGNFWCCTGSGMESFTKLNDSIYYNAGNAVYVSLYVASKYTSDTVSFTLEADLENSDSVTFKVDSGSTILRLRKPAWTETFDVTVNGGKVITTGEEDFVSVAVKKGDTVAVNMKKTVQAYNLPDGENVYAFKYGPFVLSAELGTENMKTGTTGVNVTIATLPTGNKTYSVNANSVSDFMEDINSHMTKGENGKFTLACNNGTLTYSYHFRQYQQRYGIYFAFTAEAVEDEVVDFEWITQDTVQPGYGQYEVDSLHNMQDNGSTGTTNVPVLGTTRAADQGGSFTYRMVVDKSGQNRLVVQFAKADNGKTILIKSGDVTLYSATLSYAGASDMYSVSVALPDSLVQTATSVQSGGTAVSVLGITFSGIGGAASARVCSYIYSQYLKNNTLYFVDCGDYNPATVSEGDVLGLYNSVTEQVYGTDAVTGKKWGLVDNHSVNIAGTAPNGIYTNSTWAYEFDLTDGADKTLSNRYTKNQYESGVERNLHYKFELEDGTYTVKMYFTDPWSCSKNPCVSANGETKVTNGMVNEELTFKVTVTNGELVLDITSSDLCINLCYIKIVK